MKNFKELDKRNVYEVEEAIRKSWGGIMSITEKQNELRKNEENFVFYDGPATANGFPVIRYTKSIFSNFLLNQGIIGYSRLIQNT